jgi:hypothetical protein
MTHDEKGTLPVIEGLTEVKNLGLVRTPVRTRESGATLSGWRLAVESAQGPGAIERIEARGAEDWYRGSGVFLGWPQDRLARVYGQLLPPRVAPDPDPGQLG